MFTCDAYSINRDDRIVSAFSEAVHDTMIEFEQEAATQVRKPYGNCDRTVGNLVWVEYRVVAVRQS